MAKGTFYIYFNTKSDIILEMLRQYDTYYDQIMAGLPDDLSIDQQMEEIVKGACRFTEEVIGLDLIRVLYVKQLTEGQEHPGLLNEDRALFRILSSCSPRDSAPEFMTRLWMYPIPPASFCTASARAFSSGVPVGVSSI